MMPFDLPASAPFSKAIVKQSSLSHSPLVDLRITIHELTGKPVRTLLDEKVVPGNELNVIWDGRNARGINMPAGVYFVQFQTGKAVQNAKIVRVQ
jgi:flagellar hook assembly protein FlgD